MGYANAIPRLRAEESSGLAQAVAVGSGTLRRHDADRIMRDWQKQAGEQPRHQKPKTREEFLTGLAAAGIKVETVNV